MLVVRRKKLSFVIHLEFIYNRHRPMIGLNKLTFVNEMIKCLGYKNKGYKGRSTCKP